ncbi:rhodanese-like domain-containing protein [Nocardioides panacisoli]|uniref:rhodanese-like domain-containing protein n=1 Tax=Nocardioides panacisoli TaxID=627624 RepID=UPI001C62D60A|nr:rhodanese-like domain-containing protein [Nocardioides panacisoli]QYJ02794.1 rhodanese-like domain-containing protein [Nocardioides panacisoli]
MREIDIDALATALDEGAVLVDVREPGEYAEGHVPAAVNIPMGQLPRRTDELDSDLPVHVICASGNRSSAMTDVLAGAGFAAVNVRGGTQAWADSGRPVERS